MTKTPYIIWNDRYSVGHDEMDSHHRKIFSLINELYESMKTLSGTQLETLLEALWDYSRVHFQAEEDLLRFAEYPGLAEQENAHRNYERRLQSLVSQTRGDYRSFAEDYLCFLREWWLNHILKMDACYADYVRKADRKRTD